MTGIVLKMADKFIARVSEPIPIIKAELMRTGLLRVTGVFFKLWHSEKICDVSDG